MTRQRALIAKIIHSSPRHLTAEEILQAAQRELPSLARGTVYRNLKLMEDAGEITRLELPDGPDRYDRTTAPHGHLYCVGCGALRDIPVDALLPQLETAIGAPVLGYQLTVQYRCARCRQSMPEADAK